MRAGIVAKKMGMSSFFSEKGEKIAVTLLKVENCRVLFRKVLAKDGYNALVVGAFNIKENKLSKPVRGMYKKLDVAPCKTIKEFRVSEECFEEEGGVLDVSYFQVGKYVDVTATSQGKGFAGVMKRHNFRGLEASHGVSISHRAHGSTGCRQDPGRVFKNKKMAGHMGGVRVTTQNLCIIGINVDDNLLILKGCVPGAKNSEVLVRDAVKKLMATY